MDYRTVHIPIGGGIDEHVHPFSLPITGAATVLNGVFRKDGSIEKRKGLDLLTNNVSDGFGTMPPSITRLMGHENELLACDGDTLYSYADTVPEWKRIDRVPRPILTRTQLARADVSLLDSDVTIASGQALVAYIRHDSSTVALTGTPMFSVLDTTSGARIWSDKAITATVTAYQTRCIAVGQYIIIAYVDGANLVTYRYNTATPNVPPTSLATISTTYPTGVGTVGYDLCALDSSTWAITWGEGGGTLKVANYDTAGSQLNVATFGAAGATCMGIAGQTGANETLYIAYCLVTPDNRVVHTGRNPTTLAQIYAPTPLETGMAGIATRMSVCRMTQSSAAIVFSEGANIVGADVTLNRYNINNLGVVQGNRHRVFATTLASKPFMDNGYMLALTATMTGLPYSRYMLVDLAAYDTTNTTGSFRAVAAAKIGQVAWHRSTGSLSGIASPSPGVYWTTAQALASADTLIGKAGIDLLALDFTDRRAQMPATLGNNLCLSGGIPQQYTGSRAVEIGFHYPPYIGTITPSTTGGSMADGTYSYFACYEWYDNERGQIHRSAPGIAVSATITGGGGNGKITLVVSCLQFTDRTDNDQGLSPPVAIVIYRTQAGGATYTRMTAMDVPAGSDNLIGTESITIIDTASDSSIATNPFLYTTGGVVAHDPPPSSPISCVHRNRLWLGGGDDARELWYSGEFVIGEAPWFTLGQTITVADGGAVTGLASLGQALIVFKRDRIYRIFGDGLDATGQNSTLTKPDLIPGNVGCVNANSVITTDDGVFFLSDKGIYLLTPSFQLAYVGQNVEDSIAGSPVLYAVAVKPNDRQMVWCTANAGQSFGKTFVYETARRAWSIHQFTGTGNHFNVPFVAAASRGANFYYADSFGRVYQESATSYKDAGAFVGLEWASPWVHVGDLQGFQRVRELLIDAERFDAHDLFISTFIDYNPSVDRQAPFDNATIAALPREQVRVHIARKCQAIKVQIDENPAGGTTTGQGFRLVSVAMRIGVKGTPYKALPASAKG